MATQFNNYLVEDKENIAPYVKHSTQVIGVPSNIQFKSNYGYLYSKETNTKREPFAPLSVKLVR
jgi:hypothetical protein